MSISDVGQVAGRVMAQGRVSFETATTLAFLDAYPVTEGHALVVPKRHVVSIFELPQEELATLWT